MYPSAASAAELPFARDVEFSGNEAGKCPCDRVLLFKSQKLTDDGKLWFENPDTKDLVRNEVVEKILPILQLWMDLGTGRAEKVAKIIFQDFERGFLDALHLSDADHTRQFLPARVSPVCPMVRLGRSLPNRVHQGYR